MDYSGTLSQRSCAKLNALGRTELEKIGKRVRLHNLKIPEFGAGYKRPNAGG
jgi:hypothetical protein